MPLKKLIKIFIITIFLFVPFFSLGANASGCKIKNVVIDNSDRVVFIEGEGNFKTDITTSVYTPNQNNKSVNYINNITSFTISNPDRFVVDIPNSILTGSSRTYKIENSSALKSVAISQFSTNPNVVRVVFLTKPGFETNKFKVLTNGKTIAVRYNDKIVENSIQHKFYTPVGDMDKSATLQNTSSTLTYNATGETITLAPRLTTKYYLSKISQNSDGLILRGLGELSFQRAVYSDDNTQATLILDNASVVSKYENKTYIVPSSNENNKATLTINSYGDKKVKLTLLGDNLRDYRFVMAPDGQSLFISHRSYIINTLFSSNTPRINSYKLEKTSTDYVTFEINFSNSVAYDVFEQNDNFYLDINNLADYNATLFAEMLKTSKIKITPIKISTDKTRYTISTKTEDYSLNFAYGNVESNSKSIKLCFKLKAPTVEKTTEPNKQENPEVIAKTNVDKKADNINVIYVPKDEDSGRKILKPKKNKDDTTISSMKKIVLDPGHGGSDGGAIRGMYYEKSLNLTVAKLIQEKLEKKNVYVHMTRDKDITLTLEDRVNFSNELNPDIYVSIHTNSTVKEDSFGLETHYFKEDSLDLANTIHCHFANEKNLKDWETKDRGVIKSRFYVINHTEAPSVLIEIGFISNPDERKKLFTKQRQEEIADSIAKGILEYLKVK